jgi:signal transduction histidine kinase
MLFASKNPACQTTLKSSFIWDAFLIPITFVVVFFISSFFNFSEQYTEWAAHHESTLNIDELPLATLAMLAATVWFSWRRWMEIRSLLKQNHVLLQHATRMQENERRKIAQDLHDELGQYLNAIRLESASLKSVSKSDEKTQVIAGRISEHASHAYQMAKQLMHRLRPVALDDLGLHAALNHLISTWQTSSHTQSNNKVVYQLQVRGNIDQLPEDLAIDVYRIVQECLTNASRHASANQIDIYIEASSQQLTMQIKDDGIGFTPHITHKGLGLAGMRERVQNHLGSFNLSTKTGHGCELSIVIPMAST